MSVSEAAEQVASKVAYPIAVYQMGKVGSRSIVDSGNALDLPNPVYHIHILSEKSLSKAIDHRLSKGFPISLQQEDSKLLRAYLEEDQRKFAKVITAV